MTMKKMTVAKSAEVGGTSTRAATAHALLAATGLALLLEAADAKAILSSASSLTSNAHRQHHMHHEDVVVKTSLGAIRGVKQTYNGHVVRAFLGVPYARTPKGSRRFGRPEMVEPWNGEFIADQPARTCYFSIDSMFPDFPGAEMWNPPNEMDEDCLSMNIWVPERQDGSVMVWIYGGGFFSGSPSLDLYDGRVLAVHERTIVVNINYRLGPFGFLYLGAQSAVPGNVGLLDQQVALRWIHENIGHFGGDPQRVTLFGESAGGASASAHLFAPGSVNFFNRVIAKSGVVSNNWATKPKEVMLDISLSLVRRLNCTPPISPTTHVNAPIAGNDLQRSSANTDEALTASDIESAVACLAKIPASLVQQEADHIAATLYRVPMTFAFVPIDEDENFFHGNLFDKIRRRDFKKDVDLMLGSVKDEGPYWLPYYLYRYGFVFNHTISAEDRHNQALISESEYNRAFDAFLPYFGGSPLIRHALMHAYMRLNSPLLEQQHHSGSASMEDGDGGALAIDERRSRWRDGVARFLGDYFFTCSIAEFADLMADNVFGSVYMYYFTKRSAINPWPRWMGVMHGYEIEYVFGQSLRLPQLYSPADLEVEQLFSRKIIEFWGRFAKTGEPVDYWPKYNKITRKSLVLNEDIIRGASHSRLYIDVHGRFCRLLDEAEMVARSEVRARHSSMSLSTRAAAASSTKNRDSHAIGGSHLLANSATRSVCSACSSLLLFLLPALVASFVRCNIYL